MDDVCCNQNCNQGDNCPLRVRAAAVDRRQKPEGRRVAFMVVLRDLFGVSPHEQRQRDGDRRATVRRMEDKMKGKK